MQSSEFGSASLSPSMPKWHTITPNIRRSVRLEFCTVGYEQVRDRNIGRIIENERYRFVLKPLHKNNLGKNESKPDIRRACRILKVMQDEEDSRQVVLQRIRNRIIENLEMFADRREPEVALSLLEAWADWVDISLDDHYQPPVFTEEEREWTKRVDDAWNDVDTNSRVDSPEMLRLQDASHEALAVFQKRGRLSEKFENV